MNILGGGGCHRFSRTALKGLPFWQIEDIEDIKIQQSYFPFKPHLAVSHMSTERNDLTQGVFQPVSITGGEKSKV